MRERSEGGFTLIEVMAVAVIGALLLGLSASALREYSRAKALESAHTTTVSMLRSVQQRSSTDGYPRAYGIRFLKNGTRWDVVRYDASTGTCNVVESHDLTNTVIVAPVTDFPSSPAATACANASPGGSADYEVALFYARGTATAGTVEFKLDGTSKSRSLSVNAATGRVS